MVEGRGYNAKYGASRVKLIRFDARSGCATTLNLEYRSPTMGATGRTD